MNADQKTFLKPNYYLFAKALYECNWTTLAIADDDIDYEDSIVGFVMYKIIENNSDMECKKQCWIEGYMIDRDFQGKGYGKNALIKLMDLLENHIKCEEIRLTNVLENLRAKKLYENLGFETSGKFIDGKELMIKKFNIK